MPDGFVIKLWSLARSLRYCPTPSAFSLRCNAERSMPTNSAVREILPEKTADLGVSSRNKRSALRRIGVFVAPCRIIAAPSRPADAGSSLSICWSDDDTF
jgi:hypothetical protein